MAIEFKGKKKQTHLKIMHAAKILFEQKGLYNVTIEEISEAASICRSTFFNHFATMDDLLIGLARQEMADITEEFAVEKAEGKEAVKMIMNKLIDDTVPYPYLIMQLIFKLILKHEDSDSISKIWELVETNIKKAIEGKETAYSSEELTSLLIGNYFGSVFGAFVANRPVDGDALKQMISKAADDLLG